MVNAKQTRAATLSSRILFQIGMKRKAASLIPRPVKSATANLYRHQPCLEYLMRFLLKAAFWFTVVVLFLPKDPADLTGSHRTPPADVDVSEAYNLLLNIQNMCAEQPEICQAGADGLAALQNGTQGSADVIAKILAFQSGSNGSADRDRDSK